MTSTGYAVQSLYVFSVWISAWARGVVWYCMWCCAHVLISHMWTSRWEWGVRL